MTTQLASRGLRLCSSEKVEELKSEREEKTKREKIFKKSLWIGILAFLFGFILFVLHNWFGYWVSVLQFKYDSCARPGMYIMEHFPLWLIGKGACRSESGLFYLAEARGEDTLPYVKHAFETSEGMRKSYAALCLAEDLGFYSEDVVDALIEGLKSGDAHDFGRALGHMGLRAQRAIPDLVRAFHPSKDPTVDNPLRDILWMIFPQYKRVLNHLSGNYQNNTDEKIRKYAEGILMALGDKGSTPESVLCKKLEIFKKEMREKGLEDNAERVLLWKDETYRRTLYFLGIVYASNMKSLFQMLGSSDKLDRIHAVMLLMEIEGHIELVSFAALQKAIDKMKKALELEKDEEVRDMLQVRIEEFNKKLEKKQ